MESPLDEKIQDYYKRGLEKDRLLNEGGKLERIRTQEIITRYLPKPPARIYDIGGGAGIYALWLAGLGYEVHLVDGMPLHVEQALKESEGQRDHPLASAQVGDARRLEFADASADTVLLFGPLYHLTEKPDRIKAIREAYRVLKPGGFVFAAVISRFASLIDGLVHGFLLDPHFAELVERALIDGQHRNPTGRPGYFSTAYFHHPSEVGAELGEAGFQVPAILAIEGPARVIQNVDDFWNNPEKREQLLQLIRTVESDPTLLGASSHIMGIGRK